MQSVKLLILFIVWLISLAAFSFLVLPYKGELFGISIAVVYLIVITSLMDKWVLLFLLATPAKRGDPTLERLSNISYGHNVRGISLFYSRLSLGNILAIEWKGKKIVIIDKHLSGSAQLESSFECLIKSFKSGIVKKNSWLVLVFTVYNLPLVFLEKAFGKFSIYNFLVTIWLTPFSLIFESYDAKKYDQVFSDSMESEVGVFDIYTSSVIDMIGIYKNKNRDLLSVVFKKECT